jgi:hypothetical protein
MIKPWLFLIKSINTGSLTGLRAGDILNSLVQAKGGLATALSQVTSSITPSTIISNW